jgi:predicted NUDIX family NTP pyrophosphohydrolase
MPKLSAGLLVYRVTEGKIVEVLIVHPGGPFWARKDDGAWSLPKGEYEEPEDPHAVAFREFEEELGMSAPVAEDEISLGELKQPSGKRVIAWALPGDFDVSKVESNTFEIEWPRGSGKKQSFPEIDRAGWFSVIEARTKLLKGHAPFLDRLMTELRSRKGESLLEGSVIESDDQPSLFQ